MIEPDFQNFFLAIAGASAALIGLLFVAVSVAPEQIVGPKARALHQVRATMALSAFASTLVLSLIALMPHAHIGWPATIIGGAGAASFITSLRRLRSAGSVAQRHALVLLLIFLVVMIFLMSSGIQLLVDPRLTDAVPEAGIAAIALIALGIDRSWELVGGRTAGITGLLTDRINGRARIEGAQAPESPDGPELRARDNVTAVPAPLEDVTVS